MTVLSMLFQERMGIPYLCIHMLCCGTIRDMIRRYVLASSRKGRKGRENLLHCVVILISSLLTSNGKEAQRC